MSKDEKSPLLVRGAQGKVLLKDNNEFYSVCILLNYCKV